MRETCGGVKTVKGQEKSLGRKQCDFYVAAQADGIQGFCFLNPPVSQMIPMQTGSALKPGDLQMTPVSFRPVVQSQHFCQHWRDGGYPEEAGTDKVQKA